MLKKKKVQKSLNDSRNNTENPERKKKQRKRKFDFSVKNSKGVLVSDKNSFSKDSSSAEKPSHSESANYRIRKNFEKKLLKVLNTVDPSDWHSALQEIVPEAKKLEKPTNFQKVYNQKTYKQKAYKRNPRKNGLDSSKSDPESDFFDICQKYKYKRFFSKKEKMEAKQAQTLSLPSSRRDFRKDYTVTIDSEDAKDLDDSIFLRVEKARYILSIHIADVSFYVKENSALDRLAQKRGNSVYLVERVIPMFPEELSNGICSLNEGEDRLSMSLVVEIDASGKVLNYEFFEGIIRVAKRLSYNEVEAVFTETPVQNSASEEPYRTMLKNMKQLSDILYQRRIEDGGIDLNIQELKVSTDENSYPVKIEKIQRLRSHRLVEEFMLLANRLVAKEIQNKSSGIFRTHPKPDHEKIEDFYRVLAKLGYKNYKEMTFQELLSSLSGKPAERLVNMLLLRSMKQAIYSTENTGHFALSFREYTHFTSPIRRYADLLVHRILKAKMGSNASPKQNENILKKITEHISMTERKAIDAEREIVKRKSARFMQNKIGQTFEGIVCGVTSFGLFVELTPYGIEGMLRVGELEGVYVFEEENYLLRQKIGKKNSQNAAKTYELGTPIHVQLVGVQIERGFIDFVPA